MEIGYILLTDLKIYTGPSVKWDTIPDIIEAHNLVRKKWGAKFLKCRSPVLTNLNSDIWRTNLKDNCCGLTFRCQP